MFELKGKTAFVTGAGSGIGEAIAHALAGAGAYVFVADIDRVAGERVADTLKNNGSAAEFIHLDVSNRTECVGAAAEVHAERTSLDILVNNAGIGHVGTILNTESGDLERLFAVNVRGMFDLTKAFIGPMIERKSGVIINIASIGGIVAIRERLAYCTTKFAVVGFTKSIALDHAADGIRANAVCPGRVETPFVRSRLAEYPDPEKAYREMADTQAIGRMGKPEEIAAAVLYLASDEAAFVTGTAFEIDGGWAAGK
jgi:NAD(P)-dependent dehydrogenase (short-subunit alcohol dehydrogenase family)